MPNDKMPSAVAALVTPRQNVLFSRPIDRTLESSDRRPQDCFARATVPPLNGDVHELVPAYVPMIAVLLTVAVPLIEMLQVGKTETPPLGTAIVHASVDPLSAPIKLPVNTTVPALVNAITEPETVVPLWLNTQVICPGPDESDP